MRAIGILLLFVISVGLSSWGFYAHRAINRMAVFTLPAPLAAFYKHHIEHISEHAVDPDKRRYADPDEGSRHFIDADRYGNAPFDSIPQRWQDAIEKFSEATLIENGTLPWQIYTSYHQLVAAFKNRNLVRILRVSADIGHYIADAHSPLHTTENYNGQLTDQEGIHAFWESRLPELFLDDYSFFVGKAEYISNPLEKSWELIQYTHGLVDSVLQIEARLSREYATDQKYAFEQRGNQLIRTYSKAYSAAYHQALNGMVEDQMRRSIQTLGSFWYTAWVDAGQPDLKKLVNQALPPDSLDNLPEPKPDQKILGRDEHASSHKF